MRKYSLLLVLLAAFPPLNAQIYKWTDGSGIVHFSDKPHPGAKQIDIPVAQTFSAPKPAPGTSQANDESPGAAAADEAYTSVSIAQPEDQATIRNNQGYLPIIVQTEPDLKPGDKIQVIFDGAPLGEPQANTVFALSDITRGSHTVAVKIINALGQALNTSAQITIFMQRPRVGMVPGTRPKNRP